MAHQEATSVVPFPIDLVMERLRDVESWPRFLEGLEQATKTAHNRYLLLVRSGSTTREVNAAVTEHPREHRFSWKSLGGGPSYDGELRLHVVDEQHTRVTLRFTAEPAGFRAGLAEMVGTSSNDTAEIDLRRLEEHLRQ
jgi:uncharacterized membrane protein